MAPSPPSPPSLLSLPTCDLQEKCAGGFRQSAEWWSNWWEVAGTKICRYFQCIPGSGTYPGCNEWIVMCTTPAIDTSCEPECVVGVTPPSPPAAPRPSSIAPDCNATECQNWIDVNFEPATLMSVCHSGGSCLQLGTWAPNLDFCNGWERRAVRAQASAHAKELCWLATNEALLHAEGRSRMTVGGLIEYVAREQMHAAAAEETASV